MKRHLLVICLVLSHMLVYAQKGGETRLPAGTNFNLARYADQLSAPVRKQLAVFGKKANDDTTFPFIDRFAYQGALSNRIWMSTGALKTGQAVVFNAQNSAGNTYVGSFGGADTLTSQRVGLNFQTNLYVEFNYTTGATWAAGDSLVLQFQNSGSNWQTVWVSPSAPVAGASVVLAVDPVTLALDPVNVFFRFINYTSLQASNTEDFILHYVVFAHKPDLPLYENLSSLSADTFPGRAGWAQAKTVTMPGSNFGINWSRVAVFDALDENRQVYDNASGLTGYADTLTSHLVDLTRFDLSDSVFFRFYYSATTVTSPSDSLILELRNNAGIWLRAAGFSGSQGPAWKTFIQQVNIGKLRSSAFQFRLINKCRYQAADTNRWVVTGFHIGKKLLLPFIDDFSTSFMYPDKRLWKENLVYINNHFPLKQPSVNVATFDGLDSRGNAYGFGDGSCDTLTSWPINLAGIATGDTSVFLSFFIEPGGLGDVPQGNDSLVLEMRNAAYNPSGFNTRWNAASTFYRSDSFSQVFVRLDSVYLHDDFQFRFRNLGSRTGNIKQWHLDYVRLDKGRTVNDTFIDVAVTSNPTPLIRQYASMPWKHFVPSNHRSDTQFFGVKNNTRVGYPVTFSRELYNQLHTRLDTFGNIIPNLQALQEATPFVKDTVTLTALPGFDTITFRTRFTARIGSSVDNIPGNDTISSETHFSNYFAYDDGSAEAGYGVQFYPGSVALGYTLAQPDTLVGIALFFNQSSHDVQGRPFNLMVWKDVGLPPAATGETVMKDLTGNNARFAFGGPVYQNKINGFYYYKLVTPVAVDGRFYVGWEQTAIFELNVGLDENFAINRQRVPNPQMWFKTTDDNIWHQTQLTGGLMIRPIVGKWLDPPVGTVGIHKFPEELAVYPNPASDMLYIHTSAPALVWAELFDITGKQILTKALVSPELALPSLTSGIYLLRLNNTSTGMVVTKKIIINQ